MENRLQNGEKQCVLNLSPGTWILAELNQC